MRGSTIVEKLEEYFGLLTEFDLIQQGLPPVSFAQSVDLEVVTREMIVYKYPMVNQWNLINKFGARKLNLHSHPSQP